MTGKISKDGKVAVIYSPGFGLGRSTEFDRIYASYFMFCPKIVNWIESGKDINNIPIIDDCPLGEEHILENVDYEQLKISWISIGICFKIDKYDGHESIIDLDSRYVYGIA